jgi:hypothetical protein
MKRIIHMKRIIPLIALSLLGLVIGARAPAQDTVTGAFEGAVTNSLTGDPIAGALAEIINVETAITYRQRTDARGRFYQGQLQPGLYRIRISVDGFQPREVNQRLKIARPGEVVPVPVSLDPLSAVAAPLPAPPAAETEVRASINTLDARRSGSFSEVDVGLLPLGAVSFTRSFDELALLLPGVAPPPQTLGSVAGPGQGAGVGTSGQFSANGLRSRANNFTVDGSDNNDEDIGVRRQGFLALIPQTVESVREYQAITLLAPAQFGRNPGAQVNAVSKSGGNQTHGSLYGFFNSSQLNARNFFDTDKVEENVRVRSASGQDVLLDGQPLVVRNAAGGEDSFTLAKFGGVLGGAIKREQTFYFLSAERQIINATQEASFAVPAVEQRGVFGRGASGVTENPFTGDRVATIPANITGAMLFSLFPFPNHPGGVYGANTFTQVLPARARGLVLSSKLDHNFKAGGRAQSVTGRYNFTDDRREIPVTGEALFSALEPRVRAQNFSFFINSNVTAPDSKRQIFNQVRLSYGRTRLRFEEVRDREFLTPNTAFPDTPFLLNAPVIINTTLPAPDGSPNRGPVSYVYRRLRTGEIVPVEAFGPLGQVVIAGFSPAGVDVHNFPQRRVNNTYQAADALTWRFRDHTLSLGADARRSELNSDLPRIARPLATFNGGPRLAFDDGVFRPLPATARVPFIRPEDLAAVSAASSFFLTLNNGRGDANINLRYYQLDLYAQDDWRITPRLSLALGLRYENNTPPREINGLIERTFNDPDLNLTGASGLRRFIDERKRIFEPDRDNFAPRLSVAYSSDRFGRERVTVLRAGYGRFYDQILGAVVSQSRNVYPSFLTLNFGGLFNDASNPSGNPLAYNHPGGTQIIGDAFLAAPNTVNILNPATPLNQELLTALLDRFPSALGLTLPRRDLATPVAHHYSFAFEQQLTRTLTVSAAYVGTSGRNLLRFTTPNLGPNAVITPASFTRINREGLALPLLFGRILPPGTPLGARADRQNNRPAPDAGAVNIFETTAGSRYDSLQVQARGRVRQVWDFQASYTFASARDDVSDVFDLAGAAALPQNSLTFAGERGQANFDLRHRFTYHLVYDLSGLASPDDRRWCWLFSGLQISSLGFAQSGQPFTVNSIFDVNLDGNLTDRLDTTNGLIVTDDRRQPLRLTAPDTSGLLAAPGQDGRSGRNTFRAGGVMEIDLAAHKSFALRAGQSLALRADIFNLFNRTNFGIPARLLEAPGFGLATNTVTPAARIQFSLKYSF